MRHFTLYFDTRDDQAVLKAATEMLVRTNTRYALEEATQDIGGNVTNALGLLMDQAICESPVGDLIEIHDTTCTED